MVKLFDIPWSFVFIGLCYLLHPLLGNVALAGALLIAVCALVNELLTRAGLEDATRHVGKKNKFAQASSRNAESIHGLGMGKASTNRWRNLDNSVMAAHCLSNERSAALLGLL